MDNSFAAPHPSSVLPTPAHIRVDEGTVVVPLMVTVAGAPEALEAMRPFLRGLEDCGAVKRVRSVGPDAADSDKGYASDHATAAFLRVSLDDRGCEPCGDDSVADDPPDGERGIPKSPVQALGCACYDLRVTAEGIEVSGTLGGLRAAAQTLLSLLPPACLMPGSAQGSGAQALLRRCQIQDRPRHVWRGVMIDTVRHFMPIGWLRQLVRIAAFHKLNVVRLHLTDDQGWRVPIEAFPRLTTVSSRRRETVGMPYPTEEHDGIPHGGFYTKDELRALVAYAAQFGITVVPEIDLPGHMVAAIAAYPQWGNTDQSNSETPLEVRTTWGVSEDIINTRPETLAALKTILDEVMEIFPSAFIHIGGDEAPTRDWENSEEVAALMEREGIATVREVQGWIMDDLVDYLQEQGRTVIAWDEAMDAGIDTDVVIQAWRDPDKVEVALASGYRTIASPQQHFYLDYQHSLDPAEPPGIGGWRGQYLSMEKLYAYDPPEGILGIEAPLWTEFVKTPQRASFQLLPRLAGVAEKAWCGSRVPEGEFMEALQTQEMRYCALGWDHRPLSGPGIRWSADFEDKTEGSDL